MNDDYHGQEARSQTGTGYPLPHLLARRRARSANSAQDSPVQSRIVTDAWSPGIRCRREHLDKVVNLRRWACYLFSLLRIHSPNCKYCNIRDTHWGEVKKRLEQLR
jgi:hypothetical protein